MITYLQALILGLIQGVTELFPISSLGHSVLVAYVLNWHNVIKQESANESQFLSFLVVMHLATAVALIYFYRAEWRRIIAGLFQSVKTKTYWNHKNKDSKMGWLLIAATIPAGLFGVVFEHHLRSQFAKPFSAMFFLIVNGFILLAGDRYIKQHPVHRSRQGSSLAKTNQHTSEKLTLPRAMLIGVAQIGALFAGISRSGITMVSGLYSDLTHEDAARFSFLLATPIILAAGVYKLPDFLGPNGNGVRGQELAGALVAGIAAYFSVKYLDKYFKNRDLKPFGLYCIGAGLFILLLGIYRGHF